MKEPNKIFSSFNLFGKGEYVLPIGEVRQVEELALYSDSQVSVHSQSCEEITYIISGKATVFCDEECANISGGQVHFINRNHEHKVIANSDENLRYLCIGILFDHSYEPIADFLDSFSKHKHFTLNDNGDIRILSELLLNEFYTRDAHSDLMINTYLTQIVTLLHRILKSNNSDNIHKKHSLESNYVIYNLLRYIDREYLTIDSVKSISRKLSYSEYYLAHLFKEKMGISIKQYLMMKKMKHAEKLLVTTDLSIENISSQLNFNSPHSFYQAFKRYYLTSPGDFRKSFQNKEQS